MPHGLYFDAAKARAGIERIRTIAARYGGTQTKSGSASEIYSDASEHYAIKEFLDASGCDATGARSADRQGYGQDPDRD